MSKWHTIKTVDIEIDEKEKEVNLFVTDDDWGSVYATLTFKQIKDIYEAIRARSDEA